MLFKSDEQCSAGSGRLCFGDHTATRDSGRAAAVMRCQSRSRPSTSQNSMGVAGDVDTLRVLTLHSGALSML